MNDDILCEAPGPGNMTCDKPYGHVERGDTSHHFTVELPPQVGQMLEAIMTDTERQRDRWVKATRWAWFAVGVNVFAAVWNIIGILT